MGMGTGTVRRRKTVCSCTRKVSWTAPGTRTVRHPGLRAVREGRLPARSRVCRADRVPSRRGCRTVRTPSTWTRYTWTRWRPPTFCRALLPVLIYFHSTFSFLTPFTVFLLNSNQWTSFERYTNLYKQNLSMWILNCEQEWVAVWWATRSACQTHSRWAARLYRWCPRRTRLLRPLRTFSVPPSDSSTFSSSASLLFSLFCRSFSLPLFFFAALLFTFKWKLCLSLDPLLCTSRLSIMPLFNWTLFDLYKNESPTEWKSFFLFSYSNLLETTAIYNLIQSTLYFETRNQPIKTH